METIASFTIDHTRLQRGLYVSRVDGDVVTYDLRMRRPNVELPLSNGVIHTIEHLFATYVRNSDKKAHIIYFGPMGCRTGCYFLTRGLSDADVLELVIRAFEFVRDFEGEIPGAKPAECGNWRDHDLTGAKKEAADYLAVLRNLTAEDLHY